MFVYKCVGSAFLLGFSSASASSGGGSGSRRRVPRCCLFLYVLALSNLHFCSLPGPNAPILNVVSIKLKLVVFRSVEEDFVISKLLTCVR